MITKRNFMKLAPMAGAATLIATQSSPVLASAPTGPLAAQSFRVGSARVTGISDGFLENMYRGIVGAEEGELKEMFAQSFTSFEKHRGAVNAHLIEMGEEKYLVDLGSGTTMGPNMGDLLGVLAQLGIAPGEITKILVTHMHTDHIGGALVNGQAAFPNAEFLVPRTDLDFWTSEDQKMKASEYARPLFDLSMQVQAVYGDRVTAFADDATIATGITARPLPGHTIGQSGYQLEVDGESVLFVGDLLHLPEVQLRRPELGTIVDYDVEQGARTREEIFNEVARSGQKIAAVHLPFPGIGNLEKIGERFIFHPSPWEYV